MTQLKKRIEEDRQVGRVQLQTLLEVKAERDALKAAIEKHLPALRQMAAQVISPPNNVLSNMVKDFEAVL